MASIKKLEQRKPAAGMEGKQTSDGEKASDATGSSELERRMERLEQSPGQILKGLKELKELRQEKKNK